MIFLVSYSTLTATVALRNVRTYITLRKIDPSRQQKLFFITLLPFIAAGFDLIENINLLIVLSNPQSIRSINTFLASFCATIKFLVLGIAIVAVLVIFFGNLLFKKRKTR
jgi:hypothetical protein